MEVLVGPTFSIEVSSAPPFVVPSSKDNHHSSAAPSPCIFLKEDDDDGGSEGLISSRIGPEKPLDYSSDSSSSIGVPDDSEEEGEEVDSSVSLKGSLACLDSLEDSLPIKRGLSNHFSGKSKSFGNLSDLSCVNRVKDVEKQENPFNKRRRLIMANKWSRKSSLYNWPNQKSMPLLALNEEGEQEEEDGTATSEQEEHQSSSSSSEHEAQKDYIIQPKVSKLQERKFKASFKSQSCFSLTDLQEQYYQ